LFKAGERLAPVIAYKGWRLGTLICYDVEFPETVRSLAIAGAQLVMVPTALMAPFRFVADQMLPVRAAENQIFLAYANLVGKERKTVYEGRSTIADPDGNVLLKGSSEQEAVLHTVLRAETITKSRQLIPYHQDRRPELYANVSQASTQK
jgi:predicted amidohydrolase